MAIFHVTSAETLADFLFKDKLLLISSTALRKAETEDDFLMLMNEFRQPPFCQCIVGGSFITDMSLSI